MRYQYTFLIPLAAVVLSGRFALGQAPAGTPTPGGGHWQRPGEIQQPKGPWQKPGEIQKPGKIQTVKEQCAQRFRAGADTLFEFDKAILAADAGKTLGELGPLLQKVGRHPIVIEGHTDAIGTDAYNDELSEKRAAAVRSWLAANGILPADTPIKGYGKRKPVAANKKPDGSDNPDGRALNRRVEVVVDTCK
jgi:outer membrane protein OmpA-like peptidoglycan-associated protein